jgi:F0F1-type ATP synthase membrane subunit c/vacuolar-type H+-ATPase subunit K
LRERIEDASAASLRRFDVRWVMRRDEPPSLGDAASERRFGRYFVRELREWDGAFARIERGTGSVAVTRLDDERVDVELTGTTEPALVALGMGYYPRWRATHAQRGELPVYAWPSVEGGALSVPAAWLHPGHTTFRADGPLPSDANGRAITLLAALAALAGVVAWRHGRTRRTVLQALARARRAVAQHRQPLLLALALASGAGVFALGLSASGTTSPALELGVALRGAASVESRSMNGAWHACPYSVWYGAYRCRGALLVQDGMNDLLDDAPPSPPFSVPSIVISASDRAARVRLRVPARLAGDYWARTDGGEAQLTTAGGRRITLDERQQTLSFEPRGETGDVTLEAGVAENASLKIALVRKDRLDPERGYPRAPDAPPRLP